MGSVKKFKKEEVVNQLRHIHREIKYPKNIDIDFERSSLNYSLSPKREKPAYDYLLERLSQLHLPKGQNINYMAGWVITKPKDLSDDLEDDFFRLCYEFLEERYGGEKNVVSSAVHKDEAGQPHLHFIFIPVAEYKDNENKLKVIDYFKNNPFTSYSKAGRDLGIDRQTVRRWAKCTEDDIKTEKLTARTVLNKFELKAFHKDLQDYLKSRGLNANVSSGITREQGGNITVEELKEQSRNAVHKSSDISF